MAMADQVPSFMKRHSEPTLGLAITPYIRTIPHYNKFFGWIPDSAAKLVLHAPEGTYIIGIDEGTALVTGLDKGIAFESRTWEVHGMAGVHILKGGPTHRYEEGARIEL